MQGTRIFIVGILTIFIITTYSFSQVTMEVKNINTTKTADTLCLPTRSGKLQNTKQLEQRGKRKS